MASTTPTTTDNANDPMSTVQQMISDYQNAQNAYNSKASDYYKNNPFSADDMLAQATNTAKADLSPYYNELIGNFMAGINLTRQQSLADENLALNKLNADYDVFNGSQKAQLNEALLNAGQQFSDSGGYDSGSRQRAQGYQRVGENYAMQGAQNILQYGTQQQILAGNYLRNYELPLQTANENLQVGQQESQGVNQLASQLYGNAVSNYNYNAQKTIGAPPGEDPTAFSNQISTLLPYVYQNITPTFQSTTGSPIG